MSDAALIGMAAGFLNLAAFVPYILAVFGWGFRWNLQFLQRLPSRTKPNRATWFIWAFIGIVILPAYSQSGADETIWVPAALIAGPFVVALLSIKWGEGGWTRFDQVCLTGAFVSVLMWAVTGSPVVGLLFALVADAFGAAATVGHAYRHPKEESRLAWTLFLAGDTLNLFAVTDWSWTAYPVWIFPVYMVAQVLLIVLLVYFNRPAKEGLQ